MNFKSLIYIVLALFLVFSCKNKTTGTSENNSKSVVARIDSVKQLQMNKIDSLCIEYKNIATADIQNKSMKYYNFGQLPPDSIWREKFKKYNVKVITKNCILIPELLCYNEIILSNIAKQERESNK